MLKIECSQCKKQSELSLQIEPLPLPLNNVVEVFLECPYCHVRTSNHFLSPELLQKQIDLRQAVVEFNLHRNKLNFNRLAKERQAYATLFDSEQEKYRTILEGIKSLEKAVEEHGSKS
jgi:hypothetical protein